MEAIYTFANRVVVWFGPETSNCGLGLSTLEYLGNQVEWTVCNNSMPSPGCAEHAWFYPWVELSYDAATWQAIQDLLDSPWFDRTWIMQEIMLSGKNSVVTCGHDEISWSVLRRAIVTIFLKKQSIPPRLWNRLTILEVLCGSLGYRSLNRLPYLSSISKCSNPVDKMYGILGMAPKALAKMICPNYHLSPADVYKDIFLKALTYYERLDFLELIIDMSPPLWNNVSMPSWVPNLDIKPALKLSQRVPSLFCEFDDRGICSIPNYRHSRDQGSSVWSG